jgi:hypothetical protein
LQSPINRRQLEIENFIYHPSSRIPILTEFFLQSGQVRWRGEINRRQDNNPHLSVSN